MVRPSRRALGLAPMLLVAAAAAVIPASPASADPPATLYVNNELQSCDDSGPGTEAVPFCTISAAAKVVLPGQTIAIGAYFSSNSYASFTMTRSGSADAPITFTAYGTYRPYVDGFITLSGVHDVNVSGLTVREPGAKAAIEVDGSSNVTLDRMGVYDVTEASDTPAAIGVAIDGASSGVTLSRSDVTDTGGSAVRVAPGASRVVITTNDLAYIRRDPGHVIEISGASDIAVTSNELSTFCTSAVAIDGGSSAVVENNVVTVTVSSCTGAGLSVGTDSVSGVSSDYNAYYIQGGAVEDSWAGTGYTTSAAFHAATGLGAHDLDLTAPAPSGPPPERSPLVDSADANAPAELSTDLLGNPRVGDPLVTDTGVGTPAPDRGAYERQDVVSVTDTIDPAQGAAPLTTTVTIKSHTSSWSEPVTYTADFGDNDGGGAVPVNADGTVTHTYQTPGVYTETTTAIDSDGSRKTATHRVTVGTVVPPQIDVTMRPETDTDPNNQPAIVPGGVEVTAVAASDAWEATGIVGDIDWGDGSPVAGVIEGPATPAFHDYAAPGTYPVQVTTRDLVGRTSTKTQNFTVGDGFLSAANDPVRVYDSRSGGGTDRVPAGGVVKLSLAQLNADGGGADAALVNVTVTNTKSSGFIAVYPDGTPVPATSNVDYAAGQTVADHAVALAGGNGVVDFYNHSSGPVDLLVDTYGFQKHGRDQTTYRPDTDTFRPVGPVRLLDTRSGLGARAGVVAANGTVTVQVAGVDGVPVDAAAVVMNLTATDTKSAGFITAYPDGTSRPVVSNADWAAGQTACSLVVVPLKDGKVTLYNSGPGTADFLADLVGYYHRYGTASVFLPSQPTRLMDTRSGLGTNGQVAKLQPGQTITLPVASHVGAPAAGVSAVEVNLTATNPSSTGYITAYPHGAARPTTSSVDFAGGLTAANMAITPVGADGSIDLYNGGGATVDLLVDLYGAYYQYPSN